jgi:hypothetical protein
MQGIHFGFRWYPKKSSGTPVSYPPGPMRAIRYSQKPIESQKGDQTKDKK